MGLITVNSERMVIIPPIILTGCVYPFITRTVHASTGPTVSHAGLSLPENRSYGPLIILPISEEVDEQWLGGILAVCRVTIITL